VQGTFPLFLFLYVEQRENFVGMYAFLFLGEQREVNEYIKEAALRSLFSLHLPLLLRSSSFCWLIFLPASPAVRLRSSTQGLIMSTVFPASDAWRFRKQTAAALIPSDLYKLPALHPKNLLWLLWG
jgi:hypothetical protein